jgi:hypothetical protein
MAVEQARGCGYRKVGGLYLCGGGGGMHCDRLPYELKICPVCGSGVKFTRGFQWLDWNQYAGEHTKEQMLQAIGENSVPEIDRNANLCSCWVGCPVCYPSTESQPYGLLWVGESFYTPTNFIAEAVKMGISRRIAAVPRNLKLGETWVLFAHRSACGARIDEDGDREGIPGVFYAFRPQRIEKLIWERDAKNELLEDLQRRGITPVIIPDGDLNHDPKTPLKPSDEVIQENENKLFFGSLRDKLGSHGGAEDVDDSEDEPEDELEDVEE